MTQTSNRRTAEPAASRSPSKPPGIGRVFSGVLTMVIGGALAGVMAVGAFYEILASDFYGTCIAAMVAIFGVQLVEIGYDLATGRQRMSAHPDPSDQLWHSDARDYPYRPSSRLDFRDK